MPALIGNILAGSCLSAKEPSLPAKDRDLSEAAPPLIEPLRPWDPERIGGFTLIGRLGAGAMGRVYLARSTAGRLVAVKTIRVEFAEETDFRTRFAHEVAAARRVSGAFTAPVVAADPEADVPWLATAYVPAPPLSALVRDCGPLPVPAVRWLAAGCAEALESIHSVGLVHRDLKPSNVLVSPDGPRVIDFGVARAAERIQLTLTRGAVGTPAYMPPEQARDTSRATTASDVYSLGATILFAATGHGPYQGDSVMDVLVQLATEAPDLSGLPSELTEVVLACLDRDPRRRPTSAAVLAHLAPGDNPADLDDYGRAPLPASALALIDDYRRDPRPGAAPSEPNDDTLGSMPMASSPRRTPARHSQRGVKPGPAKQAGDSRDHTKPGGNGRTRALLGIAAALLAVMFLAAGVLLGKYVIDSATANASGTTDPGTTKSANAQSANANLPPPPQGQPGFYTSPASDPDGKTMLVVEQKQGDSNTIFVVQGHGWIPLRRITVTLVSAGQRITRHTQVRVDLAGTFNYGINQSHEFYPDGLPTGAYRVKVSEPGVRPKWVRFVVVAPIPPSPPPGT